MTETENRDGMHRCMQCGVWIPDGSVTGCDPDARRTHITSLRSRCEELEREIAWKKGLRSDLRGSIERLQDERDEAREWANRRTRTANEYREKWGVEDRQRYELQLECNDLRAQLASAREDVAHLEYCNQRFAQAETEWLVDLRAQLATARNDALDEARRAVDRAWCEDRVGLSAYAHARIVERIRRLKS